MSSVCLIVFSSCSLSVFILHNMQINCKFPKIIIFFFLDDINDITNHILREITSHFCYDRC